jgi:uncharacterized membrane protein
VGSGLKRIMVRSLHRIVVLFQQSFFGSEWLSKERYRHSKTENNLKKKSILRRGIIKDNPQIGTFRQHLIDSHSEESYLILIHIGLSDRNSLALEIFMRGRIVATDIGDIQSWLQENSFLHGQYI